MPAKRLSVHDYTVGWVCALPDELAAAAELLDEEHEDLENDPTDSNLYTLGRIGAHNVVIACLPVGLVGINSAATVATQMKSRFASVKFGLLVGIGGGVPGGEADVRLGDVVISQPYLNHGGVIQYDFGKTTPGGFQRTGYLNTPPIILLNAISKLRANQYRGKSDLSLHIATINRQPRFARENAGPDILYESDYDHAGIASRTCDQCDQRKMVHRATRDISAGITIHYGTIASGNQVIKDAITRDQLNSDLGGVLCFEMEAAGLMNFFPCLVIRGICDYADSHKNKQWQPYAAAAAAACAKELLSIIPANEVSSAPSIDETMKPV